MQEKPIGLKQQYPWISGQQWRHHIFEAIEDLQSCHLFCEAYVECNFFLDYALDRAKPNERFCLLGSFSAGSYKDLDYLKQYPADSVKKNVYVVQKEEQNEIIAKYEVLTDARFTKDVMSKLVFDMQNLGPDAEALCAQLCYLGKFRA